MNKFSHKGPEKKKLVTKLFNDIAERYDFLNHFFSFGIDYYWRDRLLKAINLKETYTVLDIATGTGDVAFKLASNCRKVTGIDIAENMISLAEKKKNKKRFTNIDFLVGDAENLPFEDNMFDVITIAYGYRNISNQKKALSEFNRVLKSNGTLFILEFSEPTNKLISPFYKLYSYKIMPFIASLFTKKYAYDYLPESIDMFPNREEIKKTLKDNNFSDIKIINMTFGISSIFKCLKNDS